MNPITPVVLSGGSGTRLWPLSRASFPKQFLSLASDRTMFQETLLRVDGPQFLEPLIICNEEHRFIVLEQMAALGRLPRQIILEPAGRNTAPAACVAALTLLEENPQAIMLIMPSDHVITDRPGFVAAVETGLQAVLAGQLVTFGITPQHPETGYGYIQMGDELAQSPGVYQVRHFAEKPDLATAQSYLDQGSYLWNSGIFLFSAAQYVAELERTHADMVRACRQALANGHADKAFWRLHVDHFTACPSDSIDYAVMEKTAHAALVPVDMGWNDVGAWSALWDIGQKDQAGNVTLGQTILHNSHNSYVRSDGPLIAMAGMDDVMVVATDDAVLVTSRQHAQDVKVLVDRLKADQRQRFVTDNTEVHRPWGSYRSIDQGNRFQVKRIIVRPGERLSLQLHHHRAEHWIVVEGVALVTRGDEQFLLHENQSTFISAGQQHRLENPGKVPLHLIEVQSGGYLGEDDIIRLEDGYGRLPH